MTRFLRHIVTFGWLAAISTAALAAPEAGWLAYGDIRGHLEPCGCDPQTDLGGIIRLKTFVGRERMAHPDLTLLSLGNTVPVKIGAQDARLPYLVEAEIALAPTAVLFNELEHRHMPAIAAATKVLGKAPSYVLTNLPKGKVVLPVELERRSKHYVILGYVSPAPERPNVPFNRVMADEWRKRIAAAKGLSPILLFAGSDADLKAIHAADLFDVIISSNTASPLDVELGTKEKDDEGLMDRIPGGGKRPAVAMVPWGGQGVRRGGALVSGEAPTVSSIFQSEPTKQPTGADALFKPIKMTSWLTPATGDDGSLKDLYRRYQAATKAAFAASAAAKAKELASSSYVGAEACQSCHASAYKIWKESKHATAYATLEKKDKHQDVTCIGCHVVGQNVAGGFVSKEASPHLANVQCENCHGPRKDHIANPKTPLKDMTFKCENCHNAQHSPTFDHKIFWDKIKHGL